MAYQDNLSELFDLEKLRKQHAEAVGLVEDWLQKITDVSQKMRGLDMGMGNAKSISWLADVFKEADRLTKEQTENINKLSSAYLNLAKSKTENLKQGKLEAEIEREIRAEIEKTNKEKEKAEAKAKAEQNAYVQLSKAYREAANEAKRLYIEKGKDNAATQEAIKLAQQYHGQLSAAEQAVGQYQRQVGNYNIVGQQFNQLLRELPNAGISFKTFLISLSNNISYFGEAVRKARQDGDSFRQILSSIGSSLFGLVGLINIAVLAVTAYSDEISDFFTGAYKNMTKASDGTKIFTGQTKVLSEVIKDSATSYSKVSAELQVLKARFFDTTASAKTKKEVVEVLNEKYGDQIGKIKGINDAEKFFVERSDAFVQALMLRAQIEGAYNQIAENTSAILKQQATTVEDNVSGWQKFSHFNKTFFSGEGAKAIAKGFKNLFTGKDIGNAFEELYKEEVNWQAIINTAGVENAAGKSNRIIEKFIIDSTNKLRDLEQKFGFGEGMDDDKKQKQKQNKQDVLWKETRDKLLAESKERQDIAEKNFNDENLSMESRLASLENYRNERIRQAEIISSSESMFSAKSKEAQEKIESEKNLSLTKALTDYIKLRLKILSDARDKEVQYQLDAINNLMINNQELYNSEETALLDSLKKGEINFVKYQQKKSVLQSAYSKKGIDDTVIYLEELLKNEDLTAEQRRKVQEKLDEFRLKSTKATNDEIEKSFKNATEKQIENMQNIAAAARSLFSILRGISKERTDTEIERIKIEREADDRKTQKERDNIMLSTASNEEKQKKIDDLNARAEIKRNQLADREAQRKQRQAQFEKGLAILEATLALYLGIAQEVKTKGAKGIVIGAAVAAYMATVISALSASDTPQYGDGTPEGGHPKTGAAIVGERYEAERVTFPSGKSIIVDKPTYFANMPKGTKVVPLSELAQQGSGAGVINGVPMLAMQYGDNTAVVNAVNGLRADLTAKPQINYHLTNGELRKTVKVNNTITTYLNANNG